MLSAFSLAQKEGKKTAIATLIPTEGTTYRRQQIRVLIGEDGRMSGALSGRLEGNALAKVLAVIKQQQNKVVTLNATDPDEAKLTAKLGGGRSVRLLIEPVLPCKIHNPIEMLRQVANGRQDTVLVSLFSQDGERHPGTSLLFRTDLLQSTLPLALQANVLRDAQDALQFRTSSFKQYYCGGGRCNAWIEFVPQQAAAVETGSHDSYPMVRFGTNPMVYPAISV